MLINDCGFPILEGNDFASAAAMQQLAVKADAALATQEQVIDGLERPEAMICKLSSNQVGITGTSTVDFDTTVYKSRDGAYSFGGIAFSGNVWRPGIYHIGGYCQVLTYGTVNACHINLVINDRRGFKLLNDYTEGERCVEGGTGRGAIDYSIDRIVEIRSTDGTYITMTAQAIGGGSVSVVTISRIWAYRVRGF